MAGTAKGFAREIALRLPIVLTKPQYYGAGFVLAKQFDAAGANLVSPLVADSFAFRKLR